MNSKLISIALLCISMVGTRGKKDEKLNARTIIYMFLVGLLIYFSSIHIFKIQAPDEPVAISYMVATAIGFLLVLSNAR
jgi:hypothetical protein